MGTTRLEGIIANFPFTEDDEEIRILRGLIPDIVANWLELMVVCRGRNPADLLMAFWRRRQTRRDGEVRATDGYRVGVEPSREALDRLVKAVQVYDAENVPEVEANLQQLNIFSGPVPEVYILEDFTARVKEVNRSVQTSQIIPASWPLSAVETQRANILTEALAGSRLGNAVRTDRDRRIVCLGPNKNAEFEKRVFENVIDSPEFFRLRGLRQLGACYLVYPSAINTRWTHSLGVATRGAEWFRELYGKLRFSPADPDIERLERCVTVAGFCHDLGHGPFSHTFERAFLHNVGGPAAKWRHEDMSIELLNNIYHDQAHEEYIEKDDLKLIETMIQGVDPRRNCAPGVDSIEEVKRAALDVIANKRCGIDADRFEYLESDSKVASGMPDFDSYRLRKFSAIIDGEICFNLKEAENVWKLFDARETLFRQVYTHRKVRAMELMICDAMLEVDPLYHFSRKIESPEEFLTLNDAVVEAALKSKMECFEGELLGRQIAANTLMKRIEKRDIYRFVGERAINDPAEIGKFDPVQHGLATAEEIASCGSGVKPSDIVVDWNEIHYGMGAENPLSLVSFYKPTTHENQKRRLEGPSLIRRSGNGKFGGQWRQVMIRVYVRQNELVDAAQEALVKWWKRHSPPLLVPDLNVDGKASWPTSPSHLSRGVGDGLSPCIPFDRHSMPSFDSTGSSPTIPTTSRLISWRRILGQHPSVAHREVKLRASSACGSPVMPKFPFGRREMQFDYPDSERYMDKSDTEEHDAEAKTDCAAL